MCDPERRLTCGFLLGRAGLDSKGYLANGQYGLDKDGYDSKGYNLAGFNRQGYNAKGKSKSLSSFSPALRLTRSSGGFNADGYNPSGYDRFGLNKDGVDQNGNGCTSSSSNSSSSDPNAEAKLGIPPLQNNFGPLPFDTAAFLGSSVAAQLPAAETGA